MGHHHHVLKAFGCVFVALMYVGVAMPMEGRELLEVVFDHYNFDEFLKIPGFERQDFETFSPDRIIVWANATHKQLIHDAGFTVLPAVDESHANALESYAQNYTHKTGARDAQEWDQFCDYDCLTDRLLAIRDQCDYDLDSAGMTTDGREIWIMTVGSGSGPTVLMAANIHGDETTGGQLLQRWLWETCYEPTAAQARIASSYRTAYMPMFNPDGYMRRRRGNGNNRDLNRDFPAPGQSDNPSGKQYETQAYMNYVGTHQSTLKASVMYHGGAVVSNYPYDNCYTSQIVPRPCPPARTPDDGEAIRMALAYTWPNGYNCMTSNCIVNGAAWYQISGSLQDYNYYFKDIMDMTIEVSGTKWPNRQTLPQFYTDNTAAISNYITQGNGLKKK